MDPGPYIVASPENTYPRGKHGEIKVHRSNACTITFFVTRLIINKINKVQWVDFKVERSRERDTYRLPRLDKPLNVPDWIDVISL